MYVLVPGGKHTSMGRAYARSAAALSKHLALPCAQCLRARGVFLAATALRLGGATMTLRWVPTQLSGASRHRFAFLGSAIEPLINSKNVGCALRTDQQNGAWDAPYIGLFRASLNTMT